ncbi:MAG TPA: class I adenylate-forming enzyme family protein [Acidimicrobiales bacterium]|nr:class I adenylate-forming enzyme family protein [Acidimicrobiales bacterium]
MNLGMLLEMVADGAGDRVVLGPIAGGFTGGGLLSQARKAAAMFARSGASHVVLLDLNSEAVPVSLLGAALAGLPFVPVNYRLTDEQLASILGRVTPGVVVAGEETSGRVPVDLDLTVIPREEILDPAGAGSGEADLPWIEPEEIAVLLFTSGTTGEPKAAVLRHRHLVSYIIGSVEYLAADEEEAQLISVPPYHIAGISSILSSLYSGRRMLYMPGFDPDGWVELVERERVTQAMVVPTMLGRILDRIDAGQRDLSSLRHLSYGGGRMPVETIERAIKVLPDVNFVNAYGLTETSSTVSVLTPADHRDAVASDDPTVRARLASVGRPLPTVEVDIRDPDGNPVGPGDRGEVWVRGEQVAGEYLGRSVLTDDGWFRTRDAGWIDGEGFLYLDGRLDDVIVRGGENLSPGEIEDTLAQHPAVAEAAVVGIPDPEWGEAVAAAVVLEPGATATTDELQQWCRERLRSTKSPQVIQFRDEMPYNETGKLLRRVIREEMASAR